MHYERKMYGDGDGCDGDRMWMGTDGTGMGTGEMGMGINLWDGVGMGKTSYPRAALYYILKISHTAAEMHKVVLQRIQSHLLDQISHQLCLFVVCSQNTVEH